RIHMAVQDIPGLPEDKMKFTSINGFLHEQHPFSQKVYLYMNLLSGQMAVHPPSTLIVSPVTNEDMAEARNSTAPLTSSGLDGWPNRIRLRISSINAGSSIIPLVISVSTNVGATALTLIL